MTTGNDWWPRGKTATMGTLCWQLGVHTLWRETITKLKIVQKEGEDERPNRKDTRRTGITPRLSSNRSLESPRCNSCGKICKNAVGLKIHQKKDGMRTKGKPVAISRDSLWTDGGDSQPGRTPQSWECERIRYGRSKQYPSGCTN